MVTLENSCQSILALQAVLWLSATAHAFPFDEDLPQAVCPSVIALVELIAPVASNR